MDRKAAHTARDSAITTVARTAGRSSVARWRRDSAHRGQRVHRAIVVEVRGCHRPLSALGGRGRRCGRPAACVAHVPPRAALGSRPHHGGAAHGRGRPVAARRRQRTRRNRRAFAHLQRHGRRPGARRTPAPPLGGRRRPRTAHAAVQRARLRRGAARRCAGAGRADARYHPPAGALPVRVGGRPAPARRHRGGRLHPAPGARLAGRRPARVHRRRSRPGRGQRQSRWRPACPQARQT